MLCWVKWCWCVSRFCRRGGFGIRRKRFSGRWIFWCLMSRWVVLGWYLRWMFLEWSWYWVCWWCYWYCEGCWNCFSYRWRRRVYRIWREFFLVLFWYLDVLKVCYWWWLLDFVLFWLFCMLCVYLRWFFWVLLLCYLSVGSGRKGRFLVWCLWWWCCWWLLCDVNVCWVLEFLFVGWFWLIICNLCFWCWLGWNWRGTTSVYS